MAQGDIKLTPMLEQYLRVKGEHPDALLFYRMGDFYEMFFEDAEIAARELQIALTSRNPHSDAPVPMCGVPHHAAEAYLSQLLDKGFKVAICDQLEDPKQAKGLVKRGVTRVLTPGTAVEDSNLRAKEHNYLAALYWDGQDRAGGLAWLDFSTGEWSGLFAKDEARLWQWAEKIAPREILLPDGYDPPRRLDHVGVRPSHYPVSPYFDLSAGRERILKAQGVASLDALDVGDKPQLVRAMGALLSYLIQTQKQDLSHLSEFRPLNLGRHLLLDEVTERNLEIFQRLDGRKGPGTLWHVADKTMTPMGGRLLETSLRQPFLDLAPILENQEAVAFFVEHDAARARVRKQLDEVYDLERLSTRIALNRCAPKDFTALRQSLSRLPAIEADLRAALGETSEKPQALCGLLETWDNLEDLRDLLERSIVDSPPVLITEGGLFKPGYRPELDELLDLTEHGEQKLKELLTQEQEANALPKLKLGYNRVFGYYFELTKAAGYPPEHFIRRQTLANAERYVTPDLKELEEKLLASGERRKTLEYNLFLELRETVAARRDRLMRQAGALARLDLWQGLAEAASAWDWTRPALTTDLAIEIRAGRHPVIEAVQGGAGYIPNDLTLDADRRMLLITGPNMAGKSTVLRQTAIIVILAQIGSYVPASSARIGIADRIFSRVGASDNLAQGQSTFMVEMMETARILRQAGRRSLVILDEIGRGTSTYDGLALAWAVVEDLSLRQGKNGEPGGVRTLFATHYHELTKLEGTLPGVRNFNIAVKEWRGEIIFLRRLVPGPADRSYGIEVARLAGAPQKVVQRAREILADLERVRDGKADAAKKDLGQPVLPGLWTHCPPAGSGEAGDQGDPGASPAHPMVDELSALQIDRLTPLEALGILSDWKNKWAKDRN